MKITLYGAALLALAFLASCGPSQRSRTDTLLTEVGAYLDERPDSALRALQGLDTTRFHSRRTKARYLLLLGMAEDKNYLDDGSGLSRMEAAAAWYAVHGSAHDQMLTYFYLADKQKDAGLIAEASVNFSRALDLAEMQQNWFVAGMAARNLSDMFLSGFDYAQSLQFAQRSVEAFRKIDKPNHLLYSRMLLANGYYNMRLFYQSISLCDSLVTEATQSGDAGIVADALSTSAKAFVFLDPPVPDSIILHLNRLEALYPLGAVQRAVYAWALCLNGDISGAEDRIAQAYAEAENGRDSILVMPWEARIAEAGKDYARSNRLLKATQQYTDNQLSSTVLQSVEKARVQYYKEQTDGLSRMIQRDRQRTAQIFLVAVIAALIAFSFYRTRMIRAEQRAKEQQVRLEEKERANEALSEKLELYGTTVRETLDFGFDVLNRLSDAYYHPNLSRQENYQSIIKDYLLDVSSRTRLGDSIETNINIIHDDVLSKLRAEVPGLKEEDIKLFSFCLFGFSYKAINAFSHHSSSINTAYSRVFRLKKAIEKSGSAYTDFFLSFLEKGVSKNGHSVRKT